MCAKIIKFGGDLTKFWQKQIGTFLTHPVESRIRRFRWDKNRRPWMTLKVTDNQYGRLS